MTTGFPDDMPFPDETDDGDTENRRITERAAVWFARNVNQVAGLDPGLNLSLSLLRNPEPLTPSSISGN